MIVKRKILEFLVGYLQFLVQYLQFLLIFLCLLLCGFQLLDVHGNFQGNGNLAGEQGQQVKIALAEIIGSDLVDSGDASHEMFFPAQRHHDDRSGFLFPAIALFRLQFIQDTRPPWPVVSPYPSTDAVFQGQALAHDLVRIFPATGRVGVLLAVPVNDGKQHGFCLDQVTGALYDQLEKLVEMEMAAYRLRGFLE